MGGGLVGGCKGGTFGGTNGGGLEGGGVVGGGLEGGCSGGNKDGVLRVATTEVIWEGPLVVGKGLAVVEMGVEEVAREAF